ncbi:MAG: YIP1 family protein [Flavobacteriales bacterium]
MKNILMNPFETQTEQKLLSVGISAALVASVLAYFLNARFDGLFDMHFTTQIEMFHPLIDNGINILLSALVLFGIGKYINKKTRFVDVLAVAAVARIPYYPLMFVNVKGFMKAATDVIMANANPENIGNIPPTSLAIILCFALVAIAAIIWYIMLLYRGFKVATNAKGNSALGLFIVAVLIIEFITKLSINYII